MEYQLPVTTICTILLFTILIQDASLKSIDESEVNIIGGRFAKPDEVPYQAGLYSYLKERDQYWFTCGAIIVSPDLVLTAARCFHRMWFPRLTKETTFVYVGNNNMDKVNQTRRWKNLKKHPKFQQDKWDLFTFNYDLALLQVDKPFEFSKSVQIVPLVKEYPPQGTVCVVSGWGQHRTDHPGHRRKELKVANHKIGMQLLDSIYVTEYLTGYPYYFDNGGPLVCDGLLTGVVSGGELNSDRAAGKNLTLYTNLVLYKSWLKEEGVEISD